MGSTSRMVDTAATPRRIHYAWDNPDSNLASAPNGLGYTVQTKENERERDR